MCENFLHRAAREKSELELKLCQPEKKRRRWMQNIGRRKKKSKFSLITGKCRQTSKMQHQKVL